MATEPPDNGAERRRMVLRRGRGGGSGGGFSSGTSTTNTSYQGSDSAVDRDEIDAAIDPDDYGDRVRGIPALPMRRPVTQADVQANPASRMHEVATAGSSAYAKEYRLKLLSRLLMRGTPLDQIATQLGVSISTVEKDRAALRKMQREEARNLNADEMVGSGNQFYDEITAMAMRLASAQDVPTAMKLGSLRTALAANADRTRFLNSAGVYDALRFRRTETGEDQSDVQVLMSRTAELLSRFADDAPAAPEPRPAIRRRPRRSDSAGFGPMTFRDDGGTSSDNEVESI